VTCTYENLSNRLYWQFFIWCWLPDARTHATNEAYRLCWICWCYCWWLDGLLMKNIDKPKRGFCQSIHIHYGARRPYSRNDVYQWSHYFHPRVSLKGRYHLYKYIDTTMSIVIINENWNAACHEVQTSVPLASRVRKVLDSMQVLL